MGSPRKVGHSRWKAARGRGAASVGNILGAQIFKWENTRTPTPASAPRGWRSNNCVREGCGILEGCTHTPQLAAPEKELHPGVASVTRSTTTPTQCMPALLPPRRRRQYLQESLLQPRVTSKKGVVFGPQAAGLALLEEGSPEPINPR